MNIAVYCSAAEHLPQKWIDSARRLGMWIGSNCDSLVYGGVDAGLMRIVAEAVETNGGRTIGIVPELRRDRASHTLSQLVHTADLNDRKKLMVDFGDVFVALPGGYGTLDEIATTFANLCFTGRKAKIIICNFDGIFSPLIEQYKTFVRLGLMRAEAADCLISVSEIDDLLDTLENIKLNKL